MRETVGVETGAVLIVLGMFVDSAQQDLILRHPRIHPRPGRFLTIAHSFVRSFELDLSYALPMNCVFLRILRLYRVEAASIS